MIKLLSSDDFRSLAKAGERPEGTVFRFATSEPEIMDEATRTIRYVFSDATVDHSNDSIDPKGWNLGIFKRNPVALFSHMSWEPPIGRASNVSVQGDLLIGDIEFAAADVYEFADTIYRLAKGKFINAVSVGFKPDEWAFTNDKSRPYGIDFKKQTLLEISVCPVPCNPNALNEARSMGIDTAPLVDWAEKVLDTGETVFLPKSELVALRTQAGAKQTQYYIQSSTTLSGEHAERIREAVKAWQNDPASVLILDPGVTLRSVGEDPAGPVAAPAIEEKAGRKISAATKAKLQVALGHHDTLGKCIKDIMDGDGQDEEPDGDDDGDGGADPVIPAVPPGTIVQEDAGLTPEQKRLKEARALKATLPTND